MNRFLPNLSIKTALLLLVLLVPSCLKLEEDSSALLTPENYFRTEQDYVAALGAVYQNLLSLGNHGGFFSLQECSSDEIVLPQRGTDWGATPWVDAHRHEMRHSDAPVNAAWIFLYQGVHSCNRLIFQFDDLKRRGIGNAATIDSYIAELRAVRALYYFWLIDTFGNVPIVTEYNLPPDFAPATEDRKLVFDFVEQELLEALPLLNKTIGGGFYGRMNYWAGKALQAKLYLNAGLYSGTPRWDDCRDACDEIISSNLFQLEPDYRANFVTNNQGSREFIFAIPFDETFAQGQNVHMTTLHYAAQATYNLEQQPWNGYCSLQEFYELHDNADARKQNFLEGPQFAADGVTPIIDNAFEANDPDGPQVHYTPEINSIGPNVLRQAGVRIGKYEIRQGATPNLSNDQPVFRYADILLTMAEALWRIDNGNAEALALVNQVRNRAYEPDQPLQTLSAKDLLDERGREMFYEGVRRQDQIRFGVYGDPTEFMPGSDPCKELWPIPAAQLNIGNLRQNPCY